MRRNLGGALAMMVAVVGTAACGRTDDTRARSAGSGAVTSVPEIATSAPSTAVVNTTPAPTSAAPPVTVFPPLSASSRLRIDGIGPIDVGMTIVQAQAAAGVALSVEALPYCEVVRAPGGPAGVELLVTTPGSGRIDLIIVTGGPVATLSGIRVGSTEAEVLAAYPGRLRTVNPSLPVHRLIYHAADPALADRAVVFVIDNSRVATMYSGLRNQAEADEICG